MPDPLCKGCGEPFTPSKDKQEHCRAACRNTFHSDKRDVPDMISDCINRPGMMRKVMAVWRAEREKVDG